MKRVGVAVIALLILAGCSYQADLTTPGTPLTYGWIMAHHYQSWGVQIGPKTDGSGTHVAVYAWIGCAPDYRGCMWWYFHEYDALTPGSVHNYSLVWNGTGWEARFDGKLEATMNLGGPSNVIFEQTCCEHTTA